MAHNSSSSSSTRPPPPIMYSTNRQPSIARSPSVTGSVSGSATPNTRYGSFPEGTDQPAPHEGHFHGPELERRLKHAILRNEHGSGSSRLDTDSKGKARSASPLSSSPMLSTFQPPKRSWGRSSAKVLLPKKRFVGADDEDGSGRGRSRERSTVSAIVDDVYDSDADLDYDEERGWGFHDAASRTGTGGDAGAGEIDAEGYGNAEGTGEASAGDRLLGQKSTDTLGRARKSVGMGRGLVDGSEIEKQTGVLKMETMARTWGRKGLLTIYAGVYLISTLMSLEYNTTPTIEPFLLSSLNAHSLLGAVAIVTNIAHAVGKPPMTKILDVYGRAEGCTLAAGLYFVGYMLTATAKSPWVFIVARAIATLGGQGIQLAQQIIVADTTTLTNRALITSTISLPWLVTTWLGPPLGAFFLSRGLVAYRIAYGIFGTLLPLVSGVLICTLLYEWKKAKKRLLRRRSMLFGNGRRADGAPGSSRSTPSRRIGHREESDNPDDVIVKEWERGAFSWSHRTKTIWRDLDVVGLASLTVGCILVLLPLTLAAKRPQSWADPETWILIFGGLISLGFFGYYEFNWSPMPLLPPRLLQNRTIVCGSFLGFFHFFSQFVYESFFTSFLQVAREYSPRDASYVSQSYIFSASIAAIAAGAGAKYTQRYRWIGISGVLIHMAGTWLMMRTRNLDSSTFELVLSQMIGGIGGGFTTIAAQLGCQSVVGHQDVGIATATFLTITQIGGAVGGAAAGAIWSTLLPAHLKANLPVESQEHIPQIMASLPYTLTFESGTPARIGINRAYVEVQQRLNAVAILMLLPALFCVCSMRNVHLEHEDQGQGEGVVVLGRASILVSDESGESETSSLLGSTDR